MLSADEFCSVLERHGYTFYTGVPCSYFQGPIEIASRGGRLRYVAAANEGVALGVAAGAALAGAKPVVVLQNSGFGNLINPLTSLSMIYGIPALIFISLRAHPDGFRDEPQHRVMGAVTERFVHVLGLPGGLLPDSVAGFERLVREADLRFREGCPTIVLVRRAAIGTCPARPGAAGSYPMSRAEAIACVAEQVSDDEVVVSTAGMISRDLFASRDLASNFYMQGSMGHAMAIGLGIALERPRQRVIVLDGDGAVLMHMGALSTIGFYAPGNLVHVVIDNEAYESTGSQETTSSRTRLDEVARACGYGHTARCVERAELERALAAAGPRPGPSLVLVKVNQRVTAEPPRVTTRHSPTDVARRVHRSLAGADAS
jgi:phosphonopyruvate decarboxylase